MFQVSSHVMRWSWWRSLRWCVRIRSGENSPLSSSKNPLTCGAVVREEAVAESGLEDALLGHAVEQRLGARARLLRPHALAAEDHPADGARPRRSRDEPEDRPRAADLGVVGMGPDREHADRRPVRAAQQQRQHQAEASCAISGVGLAVGRPQLPRRLPALLQALEPLLLLQRVHRRPEAVVAVREQLVGRGQPVERLLDEVLTGVQLVEELGAHDEVAAVDPDVRPRDVAHLAHAAVVVDRDDVEAVVRAHGEEAAR